MAACMERSNSHKKPTANQRLIWLSLAINCRNATESAHGIQVSQSPRDDLITQQTLRAIMPRHLGLLPVDQ